MLSGLGLLGRTHLLGPEKERGNMASCRYVLDVSEAAGVSCSALGRAVALLWGFLWVGAVESAVASSAISHRAARVSGGGWGDGAGVQPGVHGTCSVPWRLGGCSSVAMMVEQGEYQKIDKRGDLGLNAVRARSWLRQRSPGGRRACAALQHERAR